MSILITSDLHLSDNPRDAYRHKFMQALPSLLAQHNAGALFILGDLTEQKDNHSARLVNTVVGHFSRLAQVCPVVMLQGNHDWLTSPDDAFFKFLRCIPGVTWVETPTFSHELTLPPGVQELLGRAVFLPHSSTPEVSWRALDLKGCRCAFTHQTFAGALGDNGRSLGGVSMSVLPAEVPVISGDVHVPQKVGQVTYVGAPYHIDFGDVFNARVLLWEHIGTIRSLPHKGPQKYLVEVDSVATLDAQEFLPDDVLKVRIALPPEQHARWPETVNQVRAWAVRRGYTVHSVQPVVTQGGGKTLKLQQVAPAKTDKDLVAAYAAANRIDGSTIKMGLDLL